MAKRRIVPLDDEGNEAPGQARRGPKKRVSAAVAKRAASAPVVGAEDDGPLSEEQRQQIERSVKEIRTLYDKTVEEAHEQANSGLLQIGRYVLKNFYNDDPELASKRGRKLASIRALTEHPDMPLEKTQLNNVVRAAAQEKSLLNAGVKEIKQLSATHQIEILRAPDNKKKGLIVEAVEQKLTVRQLQDRIAQVAGKALPPAAGDEGERTRIPRPLVSFVRLDIDRLANPDRLRKLPKRQITKYRKTLEEAGVRIKQILKAIDQLE